MWGGIALLALYTVGNVYLFVRLWQSIALLPVWLRVVIALLFWFAAAAMFLSFEIRNSGLPESIIRSIFWVGTTWLVFLLYMVLATAHFRSEGDRAIWTVTGTSHAHDAFC